MTGLPLNSDTTYAYSNRNITIKWTHNFNNRLSFAFRQVLINTSIKYFSEAEYRELLLRCSLVLANCMQKRILFIT